ncbi:MAG: FAD-dependent oxidoreductase [Verrucomicrobia bacterium]|nr:FAD-dependent oxidoreductase [Verrucomicrobiota bacterium]
MSHILICGAGVIGLCAAHYLRARGHEVTVVDRHPEDRDGCSFGNAGMIVPSHFVPLAAPGMTALAFKWMFDPKSPFYIRPRLSASLIGWGLRFMRASTEQHVARSAPVLRDLSLAGRALFEELADTTGNDFGLVQRGLLMLCKTQSALDHEGAIVARARELGVAAEVVTAARAAELDPDVRMDIAGAVYFPLDCHLTPQRFMATLLRLTREAGVQFAWSTEITGWRSEGRRVVAAITPRGEITADEFVLAGGSWSPATVRSLGLRLPMEPGKGYSLTLPRPRQLPRLCSIFTEARVAVTPMGDTLRVGGTMELSGLDESIRPERVQGIIEAVPRYFPEFRTADFGAITPWRGLRPCSPDGLPYLGRFARFDNLTAATGHAMMGLSLAPITGRIVAQLLSGESPSIDLKLLSPDRFGA